MSKVAPEVAEQEFQRFAELMDLDLDESKMNEEDLEGFLKHKRIILNAIVTGHVTVDDDGCPTVHLKRPTEQLSSVTFHEPTGSTFLSMDQKKKTQDVSKMYSMIQDMAGLPAGALAKMPNRDLRVVQSVGMLFLA